MLTLDEIDLSDLDAFYDEIPFAWFDHLRREAPVFWNPEQPPRHGFWAVTRHVDIVSVSRDTGTFSSQRGHVALEELSADERDARQTMLETDPPRHTHLRSIVSPFFTGRAVEAYEGFVRELTRQVLDDALPRGKFDFLEEIAEQVPIRVLVRLLGVPPEDTDRIIELGDALIAHADPDLSRLVSDSENTDEFRLYPFRSPAGKELWDYAHQLAAHRRREPKDDLVSRLLNAEVDGKRLTESEFDNFFSLLAVAGNETTRQALAHGMLAFIERPDEWKRLQSDRSLLPTAVEEVIRWATPVLHFRRTATRDTELGGQQIKEGDKVVVWYISANRDQQVFDDPYRFDVGRAPNEHLSFGIGRHYCLGAFLARLEIRVVLQELLERVETIELTGPARRIRSNWANGLKQMPVRVTTR
jgi:cytochrome P450